MQSRKEMHFRPGSADPKRIHAHGDGLVVAVDLGFSNGKESTGLAWSKGRDLNQDEPLCRYFGEAVKEVAELLKGTSKATLIIEAPLSSLYDGKGNPIRRGDFERCKPGGAKGWSTRYWYMGAGAATCLGAQEFLHRLAPKLPPCEVTLYEGFLSFKGKGGTRDDQDADDLVQAFLNPENANVYPVQVKAGYTAVSCAHRLGLTDSPEPPVIIEPKAALPV